MRKIKGRLELDNFKVQNVINMLKHGLKQDGWNVKEHVKLAGGFADLVAEKDNLSFVIEAKGEDKGGFYTTEMNFQMGLGQIMSRMTDKSKKYAIAIPATPDFFKVLQKYKSNFAFKELGLYLFVANSDNSCLVVPPADVASFAEQNCS
ncbi:MAG: hypothetical protein FWC25_00650 [Dehalococcoidia bacterium]|nr:hypothetical protein [Dehalococcoidia bacterium]